MQIAKITQKAERVPPRQLTPEAIQGIDLSPLELRWLTPESSIKSERQTDARLQIRYADTAFNFRVEYKPDWQTRSFQSAVERVQRDPDLHSTAVDSRGDHPLIVLPYLSDERLEVLANTGISGLDLCGNGLLLIPGRWLIRTSGRPNRFRIEQALKDPYRGKASLVGRTLLGQPAFEKLEDLHHALHERGGDVSLSLVSRAVQRMREDVVVAAHTPYKVLLVQPEKLLDRLMQAYIAPMEIAPPPIWRGRVSDPEAFLQPLFLRVRERSQRAIVTGIGSAARHSLLAMEKTLRVYVDSTYSVEALLSELGAQHGERFVNLEIYDPSDSTVFFDGEQDETGVVWASPLQTYIEMMHSRDSRLSDTATAQLRPRLLATVENNSDASRP